MSWERYLKESMLDFLNRPQKLVAGGHMRINRDALVKLLEEAWAAGQASPYELKEQTVEDIVWLFNQSQEQPLSVPSFAELRSLPSGRKVFHSLFGEGVMTVKNGERFVQFDNFRIELNEDGWPWSEKMQLVVR